jgi:hypothetical protein
VYGPGQCTHPGRTLGTLGIQREPLSAAVETTSRDLIPTVETTSRDLIPTVETTCRDLIPAERGVTHAHHLLVVSPIRPRPIRLIEYS